MYIFIFFRAAAIEYYLKHEVHWLHRSAACSSRFLYTGVSETMLSSLLASLKTVLSVKKHCMSRRVTSSQRVKKRRFFSTLVAVRRDQANSLVALHCSS